MLLPFPVIKARTQFHIHSRKECVGNRLFGLWLGVFKSSTKERVLDPPTSASDGSWLPGCGHYGRASFAIYIGGDELLGLTKD
jgi:hypothetical protein